MYQDLIVYQQAVVITDLNNQFLASFLAEPRFKRTVEQMEQANRSGKQNIVEGALEKSSKLQINLTSVARASYGELLEDYTDFLRAQGLKLWDKNDPRLSKIRSWRILPNQPNTTNKPNSSNLPNWSDWLAEPEQAANAIITLINKQTFLLDRMIAALEKRFIETGGYSENLFKKRLNYKNNHSA